MKKRTFFPALVTAILVAVSGCDAASPSSSGDGVPQNSVVPEEKTAAPNFVFIFADDLRYDTLGTTNPQLHTPSIDGFAEEGMRFGNAFSVLSVCSPSRATVLTGRYPSSHGVTTYGDTPVRPGNPSFVTALRDAGYRTGVTGKWHLGNTPQEMGFQSADIFHANGPWYGREVSENGEAKTVPGFIETWSVDRSIAFLKEAGAKQQPFFLWYNTQVPHMDHEFAWPASASSMDRYDAQQVPLPASYPPDLDATGKPPYLQESRSFTRAMEVYGYKDEAKLRAHIRDYYAAVTDMDAEVGRLLESLETLGLRENTYVIFMSDNGWQLGEHGLTSKVLAYRRSMQVPLLIAGPGIEPAQTDSIVTNADLAPLILELAGVAPAAEFHGESFRDLLLKKGDFEREFFYYESPTPQLVPRSFFAIRNNRHLYIETYANGDEGKTVNGGTAAPEFIELYDIGGDPDELVNLALQQGHEKILRQYAEQLRSERQRYGSL